MHKVLFVCLLLFAVAQQSTFALAQSPPTDTEGTDALRRLPNGVGQLNPQAVMTITRCSPAQFHGMQGFFCVAQARVSPQFAAQTLQAGFVKIGDKWDILPDTVR